MSTMGKLSQLFIAIRNSPQQYFTSAYMFALGIIAALTVVGHLLAAYTNSAQQSAAEVTFSMTVMRSMVDLGVSQAAAYKESRAAFDRDLLNRTIRDLKANYIGIRKRITAPIDIIFTTEPFSLDLKIENYINAVTRLGEAVDRYDSDKSEAKKAEMQDSFDALKNKDGRLLAINLDLALEKYHTYVTEEIERSYKLQNMSAATVLSVLVLEALFIFSPLVSLLKKYNKDLMRLALEDELTGLPNRRAFMQRAAPELAESRRNNKPCAMILSDLDKFKTVNDTYGHKVGDLVLQHYAKLMLQSLRGYDIIGRIGGEEFAVFLPQAEAETAYKIIERARECVMRTPCPYVDKNGQSQVLNYTSSFGIVAIPPGKECSFDNLFIQADECLYKAKDRGRNCVVMKILNEKIPD